MQKKALISILLVGSLSGCAHITPPPDRAYWDSVPPSTQCTTNKSGVSGQYAGSLLAATLGGLNIGSSIAAGTFPIIGIPLAALGIAGASDVGNKYNEIDKCNEFKSYIAAKQTTPTNSNQRLQELEKLRKSDTISESEYEILRQKILSEI